MGVVQCILGTLAVPSPHKSTSCVYLLGDELCRFCGVVALFDDITDLLVAQQEVDPIRGEHQEAVVPLVHLAGKPVSTTRSVQ